MAELKSSESLNFGGVSRVKNPRRSRYRYPELIKIYTRIIMLNLDLKFGLRFAVKSIPRQFSIVRLNIIINLLNYEDYYKILHHLIIFI